MTYKDIRSSKIAAYFYSSLFLLIWSLHIFQTNKRDEAIIKISVSPHCITASGEYLSDILGKYNIDFNDSVKSFIKTYKTSSGQRIFIEESKFILLDNKNTIEISKDKISKSFLPSKKITMVLKVNENMNKTLNKVCSSKQNINVNCKNGSRITISIDRYSYKGVPVYDYINSIETIDGIYISKNGKEFYIDKIVFTFPTNSTKINSKYGFRNHHPVHGRQAFHHGIDIKAREGDPVKSSAAGRVKYVGKMGGYGKIVIIEHRDQFKTKYAHLKSFKVTKGQHVAQGTVIAAAGSTGTATGPHLHFEIIKGSNSVDPMKFLKRR